MSYSFKVSFDEILGKGATSTVYLARDMASDVQSAAKRIRLDRLDATTKQMVVKETKIYQHFSRQLSQSNNQFEGDHVVQAKAISKSHNDLYLFLELIEGPDFCTIVDDALLVAKKSPSRTRSKTSVRKSIRKLRSSSLNSIDHTAMNFTPSKKTPIGMTYAKVAGYFRQMALAVSQIHQMGVLHRDIKLENFLLDTKQDRVVLTDFGLADFLHDPKTGQLQVFDTYCGSPAYAAPSLVAKKPYQGTAIDIWSLGIVLYVLMEGKFPFASNQRGELFESILSARVRFDKVQSKSLRTLIRGMLAKDPSDRWSINQVLESEWLVKILSSEEDFIVASTSSMPNITINKKDNINNKDLINNNNKNNKELITKNEENNLKSTNEIITQQTIQQIIQQNNQPPCRLRCFISRLLHFFSLRHFHHQPTTTTV
mmetsp:Transcript_7925/g.12029  ORF Transcript_7925/g.12029 Transcript_7925/m.12029 type:complete len:427 (+) Transcript_7925:43-1323(+)